MAQALRSLSQTELDELTSELEWTLHRQRRDDVRAWLERTHATVMQGIFTLTAGETRSGPSGDGGRS